MYQVIARLLLGVAVASGLNDGLLHTPLMGYNPWNAFHERFTETEARQAVDMLVSNGLAEAGYVYFSLDDGWMNTSREGGGALTPNATLFPSGIKGIADYTHAKGMKLGIYSSAGAYTCLHYPASLGFELLDAKEWAEWGVDLVKYDNCYSSGSKKALSSGVGAQTVEERFRAMSAAIQASGRPMVFALCEWGLSQPWLYAAEVGHMWRTSKDISNDIIATWPGILENLDSTARLARYAGPGGWNDADMLEVGLPGSARLTLVEQQAHFGLWALIKSPLIIGADLGKLEPAELEILTAREVIAINQDPLGVAGDLVAKQGPEEIWAGTLAGGDRAVALFSRQMPAEGVKTRNVTVYWHQIGYPPDTEAKVRDTFRAADLGTFARSFTAAVPLHGIVLVRISPLRPSQQLEQWRPWPCSGDLADAASGAWTCPPSAPAPQQAGASGWPAVLACFAGLVGGVALSSTPHFRRLLRWFRPHHRPRISGSPGD